MICKPCYTLLLVLCYGALTATPAQAQAQAACDRTLLEQANRVYELDFFSEAIDQLLHCLPRGFPLVEQRVQAHRIVALAYYELGDEASAEQWIRSLMKEINPRFQASPDDPLFFRTRVTDFSKRWHQRRWIRLGAVGLAGGITGFFLMLGREQSAQPLPDFPGVPSGGN